jgi:hypothetical protein
MDRPMIERHLAQADQHVALGQQHIARQRQIVEELAGHGRTIEEEAIKLLRTLEDMQLMHVTDRDRLGVNWPA